MEYLTTAEAAKKWGLTSSRVLKLAKSGRIPGTAQIGTRWMIPSNAEKPTDGRTKAGIKEKQANADYFRYPIFEYKDISTFKPPLSRDELRIKAVVEAFNACRYKYAEALLGDLPEKAKNRYIRIAALYCGCMTGIYLCDIKRFFDYYGKLKTEMQEDFLHKAEMSEYIHEIDASLGTDEYYAEEFHNKPAYAYHESFLPRLCNLSGLRLVMGGNRIIPADLTEGEINCAFLEKTDNYFDLQALHIYLACAYSVSDKKDDCDYHFRRALELAEKYGMFYTVASMQHNYMPKDLERALRGYSEDFKNKIAKHIEDFRQYHARFTNAIHFNSIYKLLKGDDYIYISFAVQGLTHQKIAERMHISAGTVGKRYGKIYTKLGVKTKTEMIEMYNSMAKSGITGG